MTKAILLSLPRSGTEFFKEALHSHPDVICGGEILGKTHQANFNNVVSEMMNFYKYS